MCTTDLMIFYRVVTKFFSCPPLMLTRVVKVGNEQPNIEIKLLIKLSFNEILVICHVKLRKRKRIKFNLVVSLRFLPTKEYTGSISGIYFTFEYSFFIAESFSS